MSLSAPLSMCSELQGHDVYVEPKVTCRAPACSFVIPSATSLSSDPGSALGCYRVCRTLGHSQTVLRAHVSMCMGAIRRSIRLRARMVLRNLRSCQGLFLCENEMRVIVSAVNQCCGVSHSEPGQSVYLRTACQSWAKRCMIAMQKY